jgi:hypothetical protein
MWVALSASIDLTPVATVASVAVAGFFAWYGVAWKYRRDAEAKALQTLNHSRDPLLRAVFELQSRIYNIVARGFFDHYWKNAGEQERQYARCSTLWLFGQFLGWTEILRREVQFLDLGSRKTNRNVQLRLNDISAALASDFYGRDDFIVFRSDQRAIGEFMVTERDTQSGKRPDCLGYSEFLQSLAQVEGPGGDPQTGAGNVPVANWTARFTAEMEAAAGTPSESSFARLTRVQRRLLDLLDEDRLRYPRTDLRGRLPWLKPDQKPLPKQVARFVWPWEDPWSKVDAWAKKHELDLGPQAPTKCSYSGGRGLGGQPEFRLVYEDGWFTISAWTARGKRAVRVDGTRRSKRTRLILNDLLDRYDRPLVHEAKWLLPAAERRLRTRT